MSIAPYVNGHPFQNTTFNPGDGSWLEQAVAKTDEDAYNLKGRIFVWFNLEKFTEGGGEGDPEIGVLSSLINKYWRSLFGFPGEEDEKVRIKLDGTMYEIMANTAYVCHRQELSQILEKLQNEGKDPIEITLANLDVIEDGVFSFFSS